MTSTCQHATLQHPKKDRAKSNNTVMSSSASRPTLAENQALIKAVQFLIEHNPDEQPDTAVLSKLATEAGRWNTTWVGGVFVTAYKTANNETSANVWCCMSNGRYGGDEHVWDNVLASTVICRDRDSRRTDQLPEEVDVTVLAPRSKWRQVTDISDPSRGLLRARERTVAVEVLDSASRETLGFAIYLPSVWHEERKWTARDLVQSLTRKAMRGHRDDSDAAASPTLIVVHEIGCYVIREAPKPPVDNGYFDSVSSVTNSSLAGRRVGASVGASVGAGAAAPSLNAIGDSILFGALRFYVTYARRRPPQLAYMVRQLSPDDDLNKVQVSYDNQGSFVRSYSDLEALVDLVHKTPEFTRRHASTVERLVPFEKRLIQAAIETWPAAATTTVASASASKTTAVASSTKMPNSEQTARLSFLLRFRPRSPECVVLARQLLQNKAHLDRRDASFGAPQAIMALVQYGQSAGAGASNSDKAAIAAAVADFLSVYFVDDPAPASARGVARRAESAVGEHGAFAANWILQALSLIATAGLTTSSSKMELKFPLETWRSIDEIVGGLLIPTCQEAVRKRASITEEAAAAHGLLEAATALSALDSVRQHLSRPYLAHLKQTLIPRWFQLQREWGLGGFRYRENEPWYRTDVTSHVVQVVRLLLLLP